VRFSKMKDETNLPFNSNEPSDDWHRKLLATLRDCGVQRAPVYPWLNYLWAILVMMATMGVVAFLSYLINDIRGADGVVAAYIGYPLLIAFIILVLSRVRNLFLRRAWQSSARSAEAEIQRNHSRRPILYLRSFGLDKQIAKPSWSERLLGTRPFANAEQVVTRELRRLGPVIAIGRPGEKLPALGAARFYVSHDRWQEKVAEISKESQFVLWATGETEGLKWELSHLVTNLDPTRVVLWAHPTLIRSWIEKREAAWQKFLATLGSLFPKSLPTRLDDARFFRFDTAWNPTPYFSKSWGILVPRQVSALRQALQLPPREHPYLWLTWDVGRVLLGLVAVLGIGVAATPELARGWDRGIVHAVDFGAAALGLGAGVAMLAAGVGGLLKRRLHPAITWSLLPSVGILYWLFVAVIGSPMYWKPKESELWNQVAVDSEKISEYRHIPKRFRRKEAYPLMVSNLVEQTMKDSAFGIVELRLDDLLADVSQYPDSDEQMKSARKTLQELAIMTRRSSNAQVLPMEYFQLWTNQIETSDHFSTLQKGERATRLLEEISYAHPNHPDTLALKPRLEQLLAKAYPELLQELLNQILRNPFEKWRWIQEIETLSKKIDQLPPDGDLTKSLRSALADLSTMVTTPDRLIDLPPAYFQLWTQHLEFTTQLSPHEKSNRARVVHSEATRLPPGILEVEALLPRLDALIVD
jgi:hypothetical protein